MTDQLLRISQRNLIDIQFIYAPIPGYEKSARLAMESTKEPRSLAEGYLAIDRKIK